MHPGHGCRRQRDWPGCLVSTCLRQSHPPPHFMSPGQSLLIPTDTPAPPPRPLMGDQRGGIEREC